ncbi:hypothetical protein Tsubulata_009638 [Turnera subulata]|uniref:Auxin response factor n=1 Tax=Turnera subulata TaxID=218843 RepID=A0A9Q0JPT0_9ROSI|nr:hypothetical protein Tsubulata_009638 [Turnera subulata]
MPPSPLSGGVDPRIWRACAGASVQIPTVNSRVYYFPQGHLEQSSPSSPPSFLSNLALSKPFVLCKISAVCFLADPVTDEVYAKLRLLPLDAPPPSPALPPSPPSVLDRRGSADYNGDRGAEDGRIVAFAKILTPSDANNGGGFSVPRFCADSIFPPLDYQAEPPVQTLTVTDIHGNTWDFRHIYRGTPRRHLLTTGWSKFVNHKKLIAGDSVVFMRNLRGDRFIGVRRAVRFNNFARWRDQIAGGGGGEGNAKDEGRMFPSGKVSAQTVAEAVERAAAGLPFEVVYYPKAGWYSDFVVRADVVEAAIGAYWTAGMRVKMAMETEDSSRMTWFQGTVAAVGGPDCGPWRGSPWRMLQVSEHVWKVKGAHAAPYLSLYSSLLVLGYINQYKAKITWDEPEVLQNAKRVSPWQVEFVATTPSLQVPYHPAKRFRFPDDPGMLTDGGGEVYHPLSDLTDSTLGRMNAPLLNHNSFPAGMQGARQYPFFMFNLSNSNENAPLVFNDDAFGSNVVPKLKKVPTELNFCSSQSENLSTDSQSSVHSLGTELMGSRGCDSKKVGFGSFQLFGKLIQMNPPVESGFDAVGYMADDVNKDYGEAEGVDNALDLSLTTSYTELLNRIDGPDEKSLSS